MGDISYPEAGIQLHVQPGHWLTAPLCCLVVLWGVHINAVHPRESQQHLPQPPVLLGCRILPSFTACDAAVSLDLLKLLGHHRFCTLIPETS